MKLKNYLSLLLLCISSVTFAQTLNIKGTVTDATTKMALPGVSVVIKNTSFGTVTDLDGAFSINAASGEILIISYLGYNSKEVGVGSNTALAITLTENTQSLDEVVVVGYGTQKKKDVTGAVSIVNSDKFENRSNTQVGSLIQGQAAGVQVVSNSGKPSEGFSIRIRGTNSINASSDPLYVVDGVPTTDTRSLNPADIETISILKDASSAAIYGAQGANGVVLITTKKGKSEKPIFSYDTYVSFTSVWKKLDVLNADQYIDLMQEQGREIPASLYGNNTNWQNEIFKTGFSTNHQISVSGKSNKTSYYLSGGFMQQEGAVRSSEMKRHNFKVNLSQEVSDWLKIGTNIAYTNYSDVDVTDNSNVNAGGVILGVLTTPQNIGIFNPDGKTYASNPFQGWENPVGSTDAAQREYVNQRLLGNLYTEINLFQDLKFRSNVGLDYSNAHNDYFLDPYSTSYGRAMKGIGRYKTYLTNFYIFDNTVTYNKIIGRHKFEALAGTVFQKTKWENSEIERRNFASDQITTPGAGSVIQTAIATKKEKTNSSYIARLNYDFDGKYLLTANFRADGSSNFGPEKKWGYFPSFSVGWRISQENFMESVEAISDLKVRAGWGIVGNDNVGEYAYLGRVGSGGNYPINGVILPGTYPSTIQNENLKWEQSEQINIGLDMAFFNNRLTFSADAYVKNTRDILLQTKLPTSTGFPEALVNVGKLQNKGLEFQLHSVNVKNEFNWETDLNISFNRNKVIDILGEEISDGRVADRDYITSIKNGEPLGLLYGYQWGGVNPATGNALYIDRNGQATETPTSADRKVIGDANPDFTYGITNTFTYKSFGLNIFLQGSQGNDIFNATRLETEAMTDSKNQSTAVLNRWRQAGDITDIPRTNQVGDGSTNNSRLSTRFLEDGSYLRIKAVTFSYNFPKSVMEKMKISSLSLYATGENLFTITNYSGFDPEVNSYGASNTVRGVDYGTYPQTRNIIFGLRVSL